MKTQSVILPFFMGIFLFAACEKSMNNRQATEISPEPDPAEELLSAIQTINSEQFGLVDTKSFFGNFLKIGLADALGGCLGFISGGVAGSVSVGALWSLGTWANIHNNVNGGSTGGSSGPTVTHVIEERIYENTLSPEDSVMMAGIYHNAIVREVFLSGAADNLQAIDEETLWTAILYAADGLNYDVNNEEFPEEYYDGVFSGMEAMTVQEYVQSLSASFPSYSNDIQIIATVHSGLAQLEDNRLEYFQAVTSAIENSNISTNMKQELLAGVSIAYGSELLWTEAVEIEGE